MFRVASCHFVDRLKFGWTGAREADSTGFAFIRLARPGFICFVRLNQSLDDQHGNI